MTSAFHKQQTLVTTLLAVAGTSVLMLTTCLVRKRRQWNSTLAQQERHQYQMSSRKHVGSNPEMVSVSYSKNSDGKNQSVQFLTSYYECPATNKNNSSNNVTVVVIHGMGCTTLEFDELMALITSRGTANIFKYDRILFVDDPSDTLQQKPRDATSLAKELHQLLKQRCENSSKFILMGHSYGGLVAQHYALLYPHQVHGLLLIDPAHERQFQEWPRDFAYGFIYVVGRVFRFYQHVSWTGFMQWLDRWGLFNFPPLFLLPKTSPIRQVCSNLYADQHVWERVERELEGCIETFHKQQTGDDPSYFQRKRFYSLLEERNGDGSNKNRNTSTLPVGIVIAGNRQFAPTLFKNKVTQVFVKSHQDMPAAKLFLANQSDHWIHMQQPEVVMEALDYVLQKIYAS